MAEGFKHAAISTTLFLGGPVLIGGPRCWCEGHGTRLQMGLDHSDPEAVLILDL